MLSAAAGEDVATAGWFQSPVIARGSGRNVIHSMMVIVSTVNIVHVLKDATIFTY